jgi:hypothetical protein
MIDSNDGLEVIQSDASTPVHSLLHLHLDMLSSNRVHTTHLIIQNVSKLAYSPTL